MSEAATLVVTATPDPGDPGATKEYLQRVLPILAAAGGKLASRSSVGEVLAGSPDYKVVLVMNFESADRVRAVFESSEYQELIPLRERGFARMEISLGQDL